MINPVRLRASVVGGVAALALLAACTSSPRTGGVAGSSSVAPSSGPSVVYGITVPPAYVTPAGTVVPGPDTCPNTFAPTLAAAAGGSAFAVTTQLTAHLISCRYVSTTAPATSCRQAVIVINTEPQAFTAFNRWAVETGQVAGWANTPALHPIPVDGIGTLAEWAPALLELGTGTDTAWVSVTLTCPADTPAVLDLAKQLAIEGLAATA